MLARLGLLGLRCLAGHPDETLLDYTDLVSQSRRMGVAGYQARALAGRAAALAALDRLVEATEDIRAAVRIGHPDLTVRADHYRLAADILGLADFAEESLQMMVDVDRFKEVNDRYLHVGGDSVLREVATILDRTRRSHDLLARYGGDEFALASAGVDPADAPALLERFLAAIEAAVVWPEQDPARAVTVSIGGAIATPGETAAAVIHRADRAMYVAKAAGRNAVSLDRT